MNCARTRQMLDAWFDRELDAATSAEFAQHLATCPVCSALRADREALRETLKGHAPYFAAPASLRPAVMRQLAAVQDQRPSVTRRTPWWQAFLLAAFAATASSLLTVWMLRVPLESTLSPWQEQVVTRHVASLRDPQQRIQIASSDRHNIKPWFNGKLDFAPTVVDLSADGYVLLGARLEQIEQQPAAALVYQVGRHFISVFMTRAALAEPVTITTLHGFSVATWAAGGVRFAAVADTDVGEIKRFAGLVQALH